MPDIILLNKPFNCLSQFSDDQGRTTLTDIFKRQNSPGSDFYPAGRLDYDSEGLLLLTNNGALQHRITDPSQKLPKTYWVQVEGECSHVAIQQLEKGVVLKDGPSKPATVHSIAPPSLWARHPPIRERANIPTHWLSITITEGRNRQVRRMTAAVGLPTLRLVRAAIGHWQLGALLPGQYRKEAVHLPSPPNQKKHGITKTSSHRRKTKGSL
ncbi:pseudouridine synthase [Teredinibacter haidensis]|uniref:pseudouridine synthase n=1 Tax=Teredinibacter haidensis TaxID=2731755 RepID=UPI000949042F|nr:pseudouridine synthase [Teredinibacter haidensis]